MQYLRLAAGTRCVVMEMPVRGKTASFGMKVMRGKKFLVVVNIENVGISKFTVLPQCKMLLNSFLFAVSQDSALDVSKLSEEIPEVNWVPYGLRLRLTEDKKFEVWNIDDEVNFYYSIS